MDGIRNEFIIPEGNILVYSEGSKKMPNVYCKRGRSMLYSPAWASRAFIQVQKFAIGF